MKSKLKSDCENCFGLCCVALPFGKSADFPFDKNGGVPCRNLCSNNQCSVHDVLRENGYRGCVSYECFGAGQHVSQKIYKGKDWREDTERAEEMFTIFPLVQQLHEMLWYLHLALTLKETESFHHTIQEVYDETIAITERAPIELVDFDIVGHRSRVNELLLKASEMYRANIKNEGKPKTDYIEANLSRLNLQGENFRGKLMIAANLSDSDLRKADFIGADLREANLCGANLTETLFLTQTQVNSAIGNIHTKLPSYLERPIHWQKKDSLAI
jgi:hypothetical protein